jgi:hypothetical protein
MLISPNHPVNDPSTGTGSHEEGEHSFLLSVSLTMQCIYHVLQTSHVRVTECMSLSLANQLVSSSSHMCLVSLLCRYVYNVL